MSLFLHQIQRNVVLHQSLSNGSVLMDYFHLLSSTDVNWCTGVMWCLYQTFTAEHPLTHSDGTHSLQSIHWLILTAPIHCRASIDSFWRHPFTAEHPLTHSDGTHSLQSIHWLILTAPIHCRASIDSFWRHPFTAEHPLTLILTAPIHCRASIDSFWWNPFTAEPPLTHSDGTHSMQHIHCGDTEAETFLQTWWRNKLILISDELIVNIFFYKYLFIASLLNRSINIFQEKLPKLTDPKLLNSCLYILH